MKLIFFEKLLGSAFYAGYIPIAPGTFGSITALLIYLVPGFENPTLLLILISLFSIVGISIGTKFEAVYGKDPKQCTLMKWSECGFHFYSFRKQFGLF